MYSCALLEDGPNGARNMYRLILVGNQLDAQFLL